MVHPIAATVYKPVERGDPLEKTQGGRSMLANELNGTQRCRSLATFVTFAVLLQLPLVRKYYSGSNTAGTSPSNPLCCARHHHRC